MAIITTASYAWLISMGVYHTPFKIIDPSDPRFNPKNFQLRDYYPKREWSKQEGGGMFGAAVRKTFPISMHRDDFEAIWLKNMAQARISTEKTFSYKNEKFSAVQYTHFLGIIHYDQPIWDVLYDRNSRLLNIYGVPYRGYIYPKKHPISRQGFVEEYGKESVTFE